MKQTVKQTELFISWGFDHLFSLESHITIETKINTKTIIETILVLDGTNGSNMIKQVEIFGNELNVSSLIITKLDGTAKGGALISIANKFEIPISYVGLGESIEDLVTFNSQNFARSILNLEEQK